MTNEQRPAFRTGPADTAATQQPIDATVSVLDPLDDIYAWGAIYLSDGRVISLAWLRGWAGAVTSRWRDG